MNTKLNLIEAGNGLFRVLDKVADATNIALLLWLLAVLVAGTKRRRLSGRDWLAVALCIAAVYILKTVDSKFDGWESMGWNYSTHSALAAAFALSLFFLDRPRRWLALAIFAGYELLIFLLGFHTLADIAGTLIVVFPLLLLVHFTLRPRMNNAVTTSP